MFEWTIVWVMLIKYRYRYMTSEFIYCFCSRWTNPICFIQTRFWSWKHYFMVVSKDVHELTVCHGPVNGPFESNKIFRGFSRSYLLPLPVQISSVLSSACKSENLNMPQKGRGSNCHGHIPLDHNSKLLRFKEILSSWGMATKLMRR